MARFASALVFAGAASASVATWGQCGGTGYTGDTSCTSGTFCTSYNPYYYQCIPGTATTTATSSKSSSTVVTTTKASTTTTTSKASSSTSSSSVPTQTSSSGVTYMISFGDSYSQTGFDYTSTKPNAQNPLGNPALPGWTASGGYNWVGYMVTEFNTSTRLSYNFAYGGATTDASLVTPYTSTVLSFIDQVGQFNASISSHPDYAPWTAANTVVAVWIGVNDVGNSYWLSNINDLTEQIMAKYFQQLQILYDAGARQFALLTVPPINLTPAMLAQAQSARDTEVSVITLYNNAIATHLAAFKAANSGVVATVVDTNAPFMEAINNPTKYGAPNATCYNSDGVSCLWFNDYHPGIKINELVASAVQSAIKTAGIHA